MSKRGIIGLTVLALSSLQQQAEAQSYRDALVQEPKLDRPERGSVAGAFGELSYGPAQLSRGSYTLPGPIEAPTDHGPLLGSVLPTYNPDAGLSEWGMGFQNQLEIRRYRDVGEINYLDDDLATPWGIMVEGDDGNYYPRGLIQKTKLIPRNGGFTAIDEAGTRYEFEAEDAMTTARGTYAWRLSSVRTIEGDQTRLAYAFNESGRAFLQEVSYGGRGDVLQHRLRFEYEPISHPFVDYRAGEPLVLDQRVARVVAETRTPDGSFATRWTYDLTYAESPTGTAYYLTASTKTFASGRSEPPMTFTYHMAEQVLAEAELEHLAELDDYLALAGGNAIQPDVVTFFDVDNDGRTDLEHAAKLTLVQHTDDGWVFSKLPDAAGTHAWCRPAPSPYNTPRHLVRMLAGTGKPHVVVMKPRTNDTGLMVCSYEGVPLHTALLPQDFELGPNTRLVDLDRDNRPDFIRVRAGRYDIVQNISVEGDFGFRVVPGGTLSPSFSPTATWVADMNGDGIADIVSRFAAGVVVWHGMGQMRFEPQGTVFRFVDRHGVTLSQINDFQFTFTDANKDGLTDLLLSRSQFLYMFMNRGDRFEEIVVPGLDAIDWNVSLPVAVDLEGKGEEQAVMVDGLHAYAVTLSRPESGLLVRVDDGKGGVVRLEYERAKPTPGIVRRPTMLKRMIVEATGEEPIDYRYDYRAPDFHSKGEFLLGFGQVERHAPTTYERVFFENRDDASGLLVRSETKDPRIPGVIRVETRTYEDGLVNGVHHRRLTQKRTTYEAADGASLRGETTRYTKYEGVCATESVVENRYGTVKTKHVLATPSGLADALHCLDAEKMVQGVHPGHPELDFSHRIFTDRNELGMVTGVRSGPNGELLVQSLGYDEYHRLSTITRPGHGSTTITYDGEGQRVRSIVGPDGVVREGGYDALTGQLTWLLEDRGDPWESTFEYDELERLWKEYDNLGLDDSTTPAVEYLYAYADALRPGHVFTRTLVDAVADGESETVRALSQETRVELLSGTGKPLAKAAAYEGGWSFSDVQRRARAEGRDYRYHRQVSSQDPRVLTLAELMMNTTLTGVSSKSGLGHEMSASATIQEGVVRETMQNVAILGGDLIYTATENGLYPLVTRRDAAGRATLLVDPSGTKTALAYDALGRLVSVTLAKDKAKSIKQTVRYDDHGRPHRVHHDLTGTIEYVYDAVSGELAMKRFFDRAGVLVRTERLERDELGREIARVYGDVASGATKTFVMEYDGSVNGALSVPGQRGRLTAVSSSDFTKVTEYRADGKAVVETLTLHGFRSVRVEKSYLENGELRSETRIVRDATGNELTRTEQVYRYDAYGRLASMSLNGAPFMSFAYDTENRVAMVTLPGGEVIVPLYDELTHQQRGYYQGGADYELTIEPVFNSRGLVEREEIAFAHADDEGVYDRSYTYDGRRYLVGMQSPLGNASYTYDDLGLLTHIEDQQGARDVSRTNEGFSVGSATYALDKLGRVIARGDVTFAYGPDGQLESATRGTHVFTFAYDEQGHRVLKRADGVIVEGYAFGGVLTDEAYVQPISVMGRVIGVLVNEDFRSLPTDARGTVLTNAEGAITSISPYGLRREHGALSSALDYAEKGYDRDLELIRMGVRDYDPAAGQFMTPDPLFASDIQKCAESPTECALYGYAVNNPVSFVDPTGTEGEACYPDRATRFEWAVREYETFGTITDPEFRKIEVVVGRELSRSERYVLLMRAHGLHPFTLNIERIDEWEDFVSSDEFELEYELRREALIQTYKECGSGLSGAECRVYLKKIAYGPEWAANFDKTVARYHRESPYYMGPSGRAIFYGVLREFGVSHEKAAAASDLFKNVGSATKAMTGPKASGSSATAPDPRGDMVERGAR